MPNKLHEIKLTWEAALKKVDEFSSLSHDWDGNGAFPLKPSTLTTAKKVIPILGELQLIPSSIAPTSDSGILIVTQDGPRTLTWEIYEEELDFVLQSTNLHQSFYLKPEDIKAVIETTRTTL